MSDEWRVEVELDDEEHGYTLGERLRSLSLDREAREQLGGRVIVTRAGSRMLLYAVDEATAREAERVARELLEEDELTARLTVRRYHPTEEAWRDVSVPLPQTESEQRAEYERKEAAALREAEQTGHLPWEVSVDLPSAGRAEAVAADLDHQGYELHRRWRHISIDLPTEERAFELARELNEKLGEGAEVSVQAHGVRYPVFTLLGSAT